MVVEVYKNNQLWWGAVLRDKDLWRLLRESVVVTMGAGTLWGR